MHFGRRYTTSTKSGIFARYLACFVLIMLTPTVIMGMIWYQNIRGKNYRDVIDKESRSLSEVAETYTQIKTSVEQDILNMLYGTNLKNYLVTKRPEDMVQIMLEVARVINWNESLYSVYLYDINENKIWDSSSKMQELSSFHDTGWLESRNLSVRSQSLSVRRNIDDAFYENISLENQKQFNQVKNVLTIITPQSLHAVLAGNIDMEALGEELMEKFYSDGKRIYLMREGEVFYDSDSPEAFPQELVNGFWQEQGNFYECRGKDCFYFACPLENSEFYYVESIPFDVLYINSIGYGKYIVRVAAIILVVMVILAILLASRIYQPLDELYSVVSMYNQNPEPVFFDEKAERHAIKKAFSNMKSSGKTEMDNRIFNGFMSAAILRMLFDGMITQEHFFKENVKIFGEYWEERQYCLLLCRLKETLFGKAKEERNIRLKEVVDVYLTARLDGIFSETATGEFAILFCGNTREEIRRAENFLVKVFNDLTGDNNYFASSRPFSRKESIQEQYRSCRKSLQNEFFLEKQENEKILVYPMEETSYSYKSVLAYTPSLIRCIVTGEEDVMKEKLVELKQEIVDSGKKEYALNLCSRILGEIDKELVLEPLEGRNWDMIKELNEMETLSQLMGYMERILYRKMEILNNEESHQKENKYYQEALSYMQKNYHRNINVTEVADAIGISYVYLNKIFKAHHEKGVKLIDYLNMIRINQAVNLLTQTNESLAVIAEKVGYNNVQSFSRFFKKYKGVTPGEWKKTYRNGDC